MTLGLCILNRIGGLCFCPFAVLCGELSLVGYGSGLGAGRLNNDLCNLCLRGLCLFASVADPCCGALAVFPLVGGLAPFVAESLACNYLWSGRKIRILKRRCICGGAGSCAVGIACIYRNACFFPVNMIAVICADSLSSAGPAAVCLFPSIRDLAPGVACLTDNYAGLICDLGLALGIGEELAAALALPILNIAVLFAVNGLSFVMLEVMVVIGIGLLVLGVGACPLLVKGRCIGQRTVGSAVGLGAGLVNCARCGLDVRSISCADSLGCAGCPVTGSCVLYPVIGSLAPGVACLTDNYAGLVCDLFCSIGIGEILAAKFAFPVFDAAVLLALIGNSLVVLERELMSTIIGSNVYFFIKVVSGEGDCSCSIQRILLAAGAVIISLGSGSRTGRICLFSDQLKIVNVRHGRVNGYGRHIHLHAQRRRLRIALLQIKALILGLIVDELDISACGIGAYLKCQIKPVSDKSVGHDLLFARFIVLDSITHRASAADNDRIISVLVNSKLARDLSTVKRRNDNIGIGRFFDLSRCHLHIRCFPFQLKVENGKAFNVCIDLSRQREGVSGLNGNIAADCKNEVRRCRCRSSKRRHRDR